MIRGCLATRGVACSMFQRGKIQPRSVVNQSVSRRDKADFRGAGKEPSLFEDRFVGVSRRFDDFGKRFDDFGDRIGDLVNRMASNERTSMAFLGLGVGLIYYTGTKIDKQSADLNARIDKQSADLNARIDKQSAELNVKIDKQSANSNVKFDEQTKAIREMSVSLSKLAGEKSK